MIAKDSRSNSVNAATEAFDYWLTKRKGLNVDLSVDGRRKEGQDIEVSVLNVAADDVVVRRMALYEETSSHERWATILTIIKTENESWVWVDLEWVSDDPWGHPPTVKPPALIQYLLVESSMAVGPVGLPSTHHHITSENQAAEVIRLLLNPDRSSPVIVLSADLHSSLSDQQDRAKRLAREVLGLAPVYLLSETATNAVNRALDNGLMVYGGAARTYLPALDHAGPATKRHRVLGAKWFQQDSWRAVAMIASPVRTRALSTRPPAIYRKQGRELLQSINSGADAEIFLSFATEAQEAADRAETALVGLRDDLDFASAEHDETLAELGSAQARIKFLESELSDAGKYLIGVETPKQFSEVSVSSFDDVLEKGSHRLTNLIIGDTDEGVAALDEYPQASAWAKKAWRSLLSLDAYAEAKARGWNGDFQTWCIEPETPSSSSVPSNWVALAESSSVDNNPKYRNARIFPVPTTVDEEGQVYMPAHIKIVEGGRPAPRVHFYDDTSGVTKKIHIGHIGPHLPNGQTN